MVNITKERGKSKKLVQKDRRDRNKDNKHIETQDKGTKIKTKKCRIGSKH
jgi:hypothetical protein